MSLVDGGLLSSTDEVCIKAAVILIVVRYCRSTGGGVSSTVLAGIELILVALEELVVELVNELSRRIGNDYVLVDDLPNLVAYLILDIGVVGCLRRASRN